MRPEMLLIAQEAIRKDLTDRPEGQPSCPSTWMDISKQAALQSVPFPARVRLFRGSGTGLAKVFTAGRVIAPWTLRWALSVSI